MSDSHKEDFQLPPEQQAIRDRCFHPKGTFVEFPKEQIEQSIPERFERQVAKHPDRVAVKTKNRTITYDALNRFSNRVARAILSQRVNDKAPVALLLGHDASVIAAILGALKAGKIYVPLDPSYPQARARYILEDSQATVVMTNSENLVLARELSGNRCEVINVDEIDVGLSDADLDIAKSPDAFAYIVYTSGSTGQPKGVIQNHRNVLYLIRNLTNSLHICADDRITFLYSASVSGAVKDIFGGLLNGACVLPFDLKDDGVGSLAAWLIREEISIYHSVSTVFRHFLGSLSGVEKFPGLRIITLGGESVSTREVEAYKRHFSQSCILHSVLGSTELNSVCQYFIDKETRIRGNTAPAGYVVEGTQVLLLDDAGENVGSNRIGEIAFRSRYLTRGYWRKPDLMGSIFLSDPEGGNARIYRTGDLGRKSADGCLEHLGRKDFQVKIRGYRIELAEIEMALLALDTVKEAAVIARKNQLGDQRLVAYLVPAKQPPPASSDIRHGLAERLPDHMIPSSIVMLDALPLTPTGKIDRKVLADRGDNRPELERSYIGPRTQVEEQLTRFWSEILGVDQVGIYDNFFDLGGDSLMASRVISRVIEVFKLELPVKALFDAPTVADLAAIITQTQSKQAGEAGLGQMRRDVEVMTEEAAPQQLVKEPVHN